MILNLVLHTILGANIGWWMHSRFQNYKRNQCMETFQSTYTPDDPYEFYGVPVEYRRTRVHLGYNSIAAYFDHKITECMDK